MYILCKSVLLCKEWIYIIIHHFGCFLMIIYHWIIAVTSAVSGLNVGVEAIDKGISPWVHPQYTWFLFF